VAAAAGVRRFGPTLLWNLVAGASGGRLLSNTSCPLPIGGWNLHPSPPSTLAAPEGGLRR